MRGGIVDCLERAKTIQGWMDEEELRWIYETSQRFDTAAHIGVWRGRSIVAAVGGIRQRVYAVDNWRVNSVEEHMTGTEPRQAFLEAMKNLWPCIQEGKCIVLPLESTEAAKLISRVDMVFIDGSHDTASVNRDIDAWLPRTNCLLSGHDRGQVAEAICRMSYRTGPGTIWYSEL